METCVQVLHCGAFCDDFYGEDAAATPQSLCHLLLESGHMKSLNSFLLSSVGISFLNTCLFLSNVTTEPMHIYRVHCAFIFILWQFYFNMNKKWAAWIYSHFSLFDSALPLNIKYTEDTFYCHIWHLKVTAKGGFLPSFINFRYKITQCLLRDYFLKLAALVMD